MRRGKTRTLDCMLKLAGFFTLAAGVLLWLIGANVLAGYHYKRRGMPVESGFQPFAFPFRDFNAREWALLAMLVVSSLALAGAGAALLNG
jgi:hypothetical protein